MTLSIQDDIPLYSSVEQITARLHLCTQLDIPDESLGSIVAKYELAPERALWTKCGWNGCGEPHRYGFVISDKEGRETTCGQDCAEKKGGVQFKEVIARQKLREETLARQRVVADLLKDRAASEAAVRNATTAVSRAANQFDTFKTHFRPIWRALEDAAKGGGTVRAAIKRTEWTPGMGRKEELEVVARVGGYKALNTDGATLGAAVRLARQWHSDVLQEGILMQKKDDELKGVVRDADRHRANVRHATEYAMHVAALIDPKNVQGFHAIVDRVLRTSAMSTAREAVDRWPKVFSTLQAEEPMPA